MPPQAQPKRTVCRKCLVDFEDPALISRRGHCIRCAVQVAIDNMRQMAAQEGPAWEKYKANLISAVATGNTKRKAIQQRKTDRAIAQLEKMLKAEDRKTATENRRKSRESGKDSENR